MFCLDRNNTIKGNKCFFLRSYYNKRIHRANITDRNKVILERRKGLFYHCSANTEKLYEELVTISLDATYKIIVEED